VLPASVEDLRRTVLLARQENIPLTVTGNGTNLLVRDGGIRGIVLKLADSFDRVVVDGTRITAQCGALLAAVSRRAADHDLTGLEFAVGIPGTIGGAIIMNAGAYGGEMREVVTRCTVLEETAELRVMLPEDLRFGYRTSALQGTRTLVVEVEMEAQQGDPAEIRSKMADFTAQRESKQPLSFPSAGSVFKRPPGHFVGPMVEGLGLKGYRIGDAQVSEKHAGFIVNCGAATARDVLCLIQHVRQAVLDRYGVSLDTEVRVIGEE
jgi:UDP-N-acetylmuramate dehydrogenase